MFRNSIVVLLSVYSAMSVAQAGDLQPLLVPQPKSMQISGAPVDLGPNKVAIVIGAKASEPEQFAAETLQKSVKRRYGQEWPIVRENFDLKGKNVLIILGQKSTNTLIDGVCRDLKIDPSEEFAVQDGYSLAVGKSGGSTVAVVAGSNSRSVIFGQDTVFQLIFSDGGAVKLWPVRIKDWPSMPHRGRVSTGLDHFKSEEVLDAVALGRLNFIDLRYGTYGTPPGYALNRENIRWVVRQAHRRGLVVYATVSLAVQKPEYDRAIATFQEFIDLGVDGLWPYLGDPGGEGRSGTPLELLARVLELGKKHGMTGDLIHYTPGKRGYTSVTNVDNFSAAKVPGMEDALWFFAVKPTAESCADAAKLGLKKKYVWWNHWPHPRGGFTSCGNPSQRADGKGHIYADLTPYQDAYQSPTVEELAKVPQYAAGAIPWGGTVWRQETVASIHGWWAWSPETHDWQQTRTRIYDYLYGPEMVETAFEFNRLLAELKSKVLLCGDEHEKDGYIWPPPLRDASLRPQCRELIEKMTAPLKKLQQGAVMGSMLDAQALEDYFFEPMRAELAAARVITELPRTEYWWGSSLDRIRMALREGNCEQALRWQEDARKRVQEDWANLQKALAGIVHTGNSGPEWLAQFDKLAGDAVFASAPVNLDGELDEPDWSRAPKLGPFRICNDSETTQTLSDAQVLYTDDALYVGLTFGEPRMDMIVAAKTEHDSAVWEEDSFHIYVNTDGLGKPYYRFMANAIGTKCEGVCPAGDMIDDSWNGEWDVKIAKEADKWVAEVRIPYSTIGASKPQKNEMWLFNFGRVDRASEERVTRGENWEQTSAWGYRPRGQLHDTRKFRPIWFR